MKSNNLILILAALVVFSVAGCDVLNKEPLTSVSSGQVITNARSAQIALNGLYDKMQSGNYYGSNYYLLSDLSADIAQSVGTWDFYRAMDTYTTIKGNLEVRNFWNQAYEAINQANFIIAKVQKLDKIDETKKNSILGQAYILRALCYFDLNRAFGGVKGVYGSMGVPIVLKPTVAITKDSYPSRPSIDETYKRVESDLTKAVSLLPGTSTTPIRVSQGAAKALLSRLYLYYKQDYDLVEQYATSVINDYNYKLQDNYANVFSNEGNAGIIFELAYNTSDGSDLRYWYVPAGLGGRGDISLQPGFVKLLQSRPNDVRSHLIEYDKQVKDYFPIKYNKVSGADNIIIIRIAEMYLNRAEARVKKTTPDFAGALADLNEIRNRAGLADTTGAGVDSPDEILHAIAVDRRIEFYEEGQRWFNILRTGKALSVFKSVLRTNSGPVTLGSGREVWPIPQRAVEANLNLDQNPGYK